MPLSITQRFGASATLTAGVLSVTITELANLDDPQASADQILAAMILHSKAVQPTNALDDATVGVTIDDPFKSFARTDTQIQHSYSVNLYEVASGAGALDPDDVVS
ncbi:MAG: hypothetical protein ACTS2F_29265 [Thainema sp.]